MRCSSLLLMSIVSSFFFNITRSISCIPCGKMKCHGCRSLFSGKEFIASQHMIISLFSNAESPFFILQP